MQSNKYLKETNIVEFTRISTLLNIYLREKITNCCLVAWTQIKETAFFQNSNQITVGKYPPKQSKHKNMVSSAFVSNSNQQYSGTNDSFIRMHTTEDEVKSELTTQSHINQWYNDKTRLKGQSLNISHNQDKSTVSKQAYSDLEDDFQILILERIERLEEKFQKIKNSQQTKNIKISQQKYAPKNENSLIEVSSNIPQPKYIKLPKSIIREQTEYQIGSQKQSNMVPKLNLTTHQQNPFSSTSKYVPKTSGRRHASDLNCSKKSKNHGRMINRQRESYQRNQEVSFRRRIKTSCFTGKQNEGEYEKKENYRRQRQSQCQHSHGQVPSYSCCCGSIFVQKSVMNHSCCSVYCNSRHKRATPQFYKLVPVCLTPSYECHSDRYFFHNHIQHNTQKYQQSMFTYI